jgi:NDP-hexose 5-epimerase
MEVRELSIPGVYRVSPTTLSDQRGWFREGFRSDRLHAATGRAFPVAQINYSRSRRRTLRGLHGVRVPPGQAKYVTCVRGVLQDIVVDLRLGSPTFGRHEQTVLDAEAGTAVLVPEGLGHGFLALTDDAVICYVLSTSYVPGTQFEIDPRDPELALPWEPAMPPLLSQKDATAPSLAEAVSAGLLAHWEDCQPPVVSGSF